MTPCLHLIGQFSRRNLVILQLQQHLPSAMSDVLPIVAARTLLFLLMTTLFPVFELRHARMSPHQTAADARPGQETLGSVREKEEFQ